MRNDFVIQRREKRDGTLYLFLDTTKTIFHGMKWGQLGEWGKRKCETMLFLTEIKKDYIKVVYA